MANATHLLELQKSNAFMLVGISIASVLIGAYLIFSASSYSDIILICVLVTSLLLLIRYIGQLLRMQLDAELLAKTLDALVDIQWHCDLSNGNFLYKGRLPQLLGYPEDTVPDAKFWKQIIHPIDRPLQKYQLLRHLENESVPYYCEYRLRGQDDKYQWFAGRGKVVSRSDDGTPSFMVGSVEHIQHRKDLEQSLIHAHKMEALGQLTGGIAHDFNNILASVLGYTELAIESPKGHRVEHYLEQIHLGGSRARNIVRQLLDFSRTPKSETQVVKLKQETTEAIQMLRSTLPKTIEIIEDFPDYECFTRLDSNQLQRVLLNLCINARDAMNNRGVLKLSLITESINQHTCASCQSSFTGQYHVLRVTDEGQGIDLQIQHKLFDPFFTTKEFGKGTGMGLSVVHGIVHDYNGHISIKSDPGTSTTVCLYFPSLRRQSEKGNLTLVNNKVNSG